MKLRVEVFIASGDRVIVIRRSKVGFDVDISYKAR
jgi:soluble P-type ATPase